MKSRDDLLSVLDLGWESSRKAWRLLSVDDPFNPEAIGTTGRDLDRLAYDLRRLGLGKPARMAYSIAFVLNGLTAGTIAYDRDLAEKTSQIISIFAEMLLELEATSQITAEEPAEIVEALKVRWGLSLYAEEPAESKMPAPHFRPHHVASPAVQSHAELIGISDDLVCASESLLRRVMHDEGFAYTTALSRIHHLGTAIRDRLKQSADRTPRRLFAIAAPIMDRESAEQAETVLEPVATDSSIELPELPERTSDGDASNELSKDRDSRILIINESPFFRMLLTSAISGAGYKLRTLPTLMDAQESCDDELFDVIICDESILSRQLDSEWAWLRSHMTKSDNLIALGNGSDVIPHDDGCQRVSRKEISSLLALLKLILGPGATRALSGAA